MRKEVLSALKSIIAREMSASLGMFVLDESRVRPDPPGLIKYVWNPREGLWCFVAFRPIESEALDVYVGWSIKRNVPVALVSDVVGCHEFSAEGYFNVSASYAKRGGAVHWSFWNPSDEVLDDPAKFASEYAGHYAKALSENEALALVSPSVKKAIDEVLGYGLPYLKLRIAVA